jgi:hypothetical protein
MATKLKNIKKETGIIQDNIEKDKAILAAAQAIMTQATQKIEKMGGTVFIKNDLVGNTIQSQLMISVGQKPA